MAVDIKGHYAFIGNGRSFQILDITNLETPAIVGEYVTSEVIYDVRLRGDSLAFVCNWDGLMIFDVSNPTAPIKLSELPLWGGNRVIPTDSFAYVASGGRLSIIDIIDVRNPYIRSQVAGDGGGGRRDELALFQGHYLYLGDPDSFFGQIYAYDCSNPDHLTELPNLNIRWASFSVYEFGSLLLVGGTSRLKIYSLADPSNPVLLGNDTLRIGYDITAVAVSNFTSDQPVPVAYAMSGTDWFYTIDISDPYGPHAMDSLSVVRTAGYAPISLPLKVSGAIGIAGYDGLFFVDANNPNVLQARSVFIAGGDGPGGIAVNDNFAYVTNGISGLSILDISNPTQPVRVGSLLFNGTEVDAVALEGSYAYVVGHYGMWTVDVSNPRAPVLTSWISIGSPANNPLAIAVEKNHAYVAVYDSAVVIIDVTNPSAPSRIGTYLLPPYGVAVHDSLLYAACGDSLVILDVRDPHHIVRRSGVGVYTETIAVENTLVYSGGTALTVLDVSAPDSPVVKSVIGGAGGTDMALSGNYVYLSASTGRITAVDVFNPESPRIVGVFYPPFAAGVAAQDRFVYLCEVNAGLQVFENKLVSHQQPYSIGAGWNMISVPALPSGSSSRAKAALFPTSASAAFTYQSGYVAEDTLERGRGYWLKFDAAQDITLHDIPVYVETVAVAAGWNLIGSISIPVAVSRIASNPANIVTSQFFGLSGSNGYQVSDTIQPGKGYWARVSQSASLILPSEVVSGKETRSNRIRIVPTSEHPPSIPNSDISTFQQRIPRYFALDQNFPNPYNPTTRISYSIPHTSDVSLIVYDILGREIARLIQGTKPPGEYSVTWNAANVSSGVYYYRLVAGGFVETKKMVVMK